MTIESINSKVHISTRTSPRAGAAVKSASTVVSSDKIDTQIADKIKSALASSTATSTVNSARVANIREAIANGTYSVNAERVAAKILKFEKSLPEDRD